MSNEVQFDFEEEQRRGYRRQGSKLSRLVVKLSGGLVKDEIQANYILLGFAMLAIVISLLLFSGVNIKKGPKIPQSSPIYLIPS